VILRRCGTLLLRCDRRQSQRRDGCCDGDADANEPRLHASPPEETETLLYGTLCAFSTVTPQVRKGSAACVSTGGHGGGGTRANQTTDRRRDCGACGPGDAGAGEGR